jgi:hypothetical protein
MGHEERMLERYSAARFGSPEDLEGIIVFIASPVACITGRATAW